MPRVAPLVERLVGDPEVQQLSWGHLPMLCCSTRLLALLLFLLPTRISLLSLMTSAVVTRAVPQALLLLCPCGACPCQNIGEGASRSHHRRRRWLRSTSMDSSGTAMPDAPNAAPGSFHPTRTSAPAVTDTKHSIYLRCAIE